MGHKFREIYLHKNSHMANHVSWLKHMYQMYP